VLLTGFARTCVYRNGAAIAREAILTGKLNTGLLSVLEPIMTTLVLNGMRSNAC
jgi:hypothetical protein